MSVRGAALAEQFEDPLQQRDAATIGMWTFLATEILFFGTMFLAYIVYRHAYPEAFAQASQKTLIVFGTINTAVLLTSSLTVALALHAIAQNKTTLCFRLLVLTVILGLAFLIDKGFEYHGDIQEQLVPGQNFKPGFPPEAQIFWLLYWLMTGVHALHVTVGIVLLSTMAWLTRHGKFCDTYFTPLEMTALYWHFVDVIWIFLYPMLYLVHRYSA